MSEDEIRAWLGIARTWPPLRPSLVRGMADVPVPATDADQVEAFRVFLLVAGPRDTPEAHVTTADEIAALKAATREAHEVLKDLRTERRAVEQLLAEVEGRVQRAVSDRMEEALTREIATLGQATEMAMRKSVAKVEREFDKLADLYTGGDDPGGSLLERTRRYVESRDRT